MDSVPLFVGLDYHQDSIQVCVMDVGGHVLINKGCANDWRAIATLAQRHGGPAGRVRRAAVEACCGSADLAEELIVKAKWPTDLCHPGFVARMKRSPVVADKHDPGDAFVVADLTRVGYLPKVWLAPAAVRELRRVVRYRQQLVDRRRRDVKLRIGAVLRELRIAQPAAAAARRWTKRWLAWLAEAAPLPEHTRWVVDEHLAELAGLDERVARVEAKLEAMTAGDPLVRRLLAQPGVGPVTAWVLRAMVGRFDRFATGKQLGRFCGFAPLNATSGPRQADAGLIRAGDPLLKATLVEAAHRLARYDPRWRRLMLKLKAAGKPTNVALAAVANRWVRWLFHQVKGIEAKELEH